MKERISDLVSLRLVPVGVFGEDDCCLHDPPSDAPNGPVANEECPSKGYGLSDAVSSWSDCNRAIGKIYRVDDTDPKYRESGDTVEIFVKREDLPFFEKTFGDK